MARFVYRMQSILNIKGKLEEQAKMDFAAARMHLDEEEAKQEALYGRKRAYEEEAHRLREDKLQVRDIMDNKDALLKMDEYIMIQQLAIRKAEDLLEAARLHLEEAVRERKTYERLREKAFEEFIHEENARESKEIDELTSYTHGQKKDKEPE
jgi:flagellar FliJ protein